MALLGAPVNQLGDFQLEYDGLLLGPGTPYDLPPGLNLLDLVSVQNQDTPRDPGQDGAFDGPDSVGVAVFDVDFEMYAATDAAFITALQALRMAARVRAVPAPLWFKLPGLPVYGFGAKVNNRHIPIGNQWPRLSVGALQFRVTRPLLQSIVRQVQLSPVGASGGLGFPLFTTASDGSARTLDFGAVGTAAYSGILTNAGNTPAYPVVDVRGPNDKGFSLVLEGSVVTYPVPMGPSEVVRVDYATGRAALSVNGSTSADRTGALTTRDFKPVPAQGQSTIVLVASSGSATANHADIWRG